MTNATKKTLYGYFVYYSRRSEAQFSSGRDLTPQDTVVHIACEEITTANHVELLRRAVIKQEERKDRKLGLGSSPKAVIHNWTRLTGETRTH